MLAARSVADGRQPTVQQALRAAMEESGAPPTAAPSLGEVRRHLQPMLMQSLGAEGYEAMVRRRRAVAEELMGILVDLPGVLDVVLAGRAAKGQMDGDLTLHLRVYTRTPIGALAQAVVDAGFEEPTFSTAETRRGRRDRMEFTEGDLGVSIVRCMPEERHEADRDLFSGRPVAIERAERE